MKRKYINDNDKCAVFPRCQHPDTRSNKDFLRELENRLFIKRIEDKAKRAYRDSKVMCIQTGEVFESAADADNKLGLTRGATSNVLRGVRKLANWKYSFVYV
jgi:hypothetical protein